MVLKESFSYLDISYFKHHFFSFWVYIFLFNYNTQSRSFASCSHSYSYQSFIWKSNHFTLATSFTLSFPQEFFQCMELIFMAAKIANCQLFQIPHHPNHLSYSSSANQQLKNIIQNFIRTNHVIVRTKHPQKFDVMLHIYIYIQ